MDNATLGPANAKLTEEGVVGGADVVMSLQNGAQASLRKHSSPTTALAHVSGGGGGGSSSSMQQQPAVAAAAAATTRIY